MKTAAAAGQLRLRLNIRGRVQGVWFRESARIEAEKLGVRGWVKNAADGSVEAVLEGESAAVRLLEQWCRQGPPSARVTDVRSNPEPVAGEKYFRVLH